MAGGTSSTCGWTRTRPVVPPEYRQSLRAVADAPRPAWAFGVAGSGPGLNTPGDPPYRRRHGTATVPQIVTQRYLLPDLPERTVMTDPIQTRGDEHNELLTVDTNNDGVADIRAIDTDGDGKADLFTIDSDGDGKVDVTMVDLDQDGNMDTTVYGSGQ